MKILSIKAAEKPISKLKFNKEGDLLFASSKDENVTVWHSDDGEQLGEYVGKGAVYSFDLSANCDRIVSGTGDSVCLLYDVQTGQHIQTYQFDSYVRSVHFSLGDHLFCAINALAMQKPQRIHVFDLRADTKPIMLFKPKSQLSLIRWGNLNKSILGFSDDGVLEVVDVANNQIIEDKKIHHLKIMDMSFSKDHTHFITASEDTTAKLFDTSSFNEIAKYKTDRRIVSAAISPTQEIVAMGGGQHQMNVTTTISTSGKFENLIYHKIYQEEICNYKCHFGTLNHLTFSPDGRSIASGGFDGYIKVALFDEEMDKILKSADVDPLF
ncbi:eukaryotic translation initiation factor 3 subunit i [Anaeramoeba ignava]|uniref:Serine-threonine kinase receptor-associated protein n=1 Tax=Anaeramoeba ignava TaxID=1746090 RepID=A0A9Q0LKY2_ANAIG|nr:eukaryotic translation initiation factor 3 subunit i [Anaeramoeba ignava]|eukprot:Anaeramoba_ignava/c19649_g1_i2.p1 GENE.c19649_g1_i2~~c19649_g1_i2.p1  ORF type:complete len:325 (-),score=108.94 c19649_g1_i2:216-1190(-)